jgi:hypothetical protein
LSLQQSTDRVTAPNESVRRWVMIDRAKTTIFNYEGKLHQARWDDDPGEGEIVTVAGDRSILGVEVARFTWDPRSRRTSGIDGDPRLVEAAQYAMRLHGRSPRH